MKRWDAIQAVILVILIALLTWEPSTVRAQAWDKAALSFPKTFPPGVSQNLSATPEGRQWFSAYTILSAPSKPFLR